MGSEGPNKAGKGKAAGGKMFKLNSPLRPLSCHPSPPDPRASAPRAAAPGRKRRPEKLLEKIALSARQCQELERQFGQNPPPKLETLLKLHRVLIFRLSTGADDQASLLQAVADMMKPLLTWAGLQEKRREQDLAERKYRDQVAAQKAAIERELAAAKEGGGIRPETLERLERQLRLL
jgi:hypothetical protein